VSGCGRGRGLAALALLGCFALASEARGEPVSPAPPKSPAPKSSAGGKPKVDGSQSPEQLRKEVVERMRALRAFRIVDELKLDETASARLFPILSKFDEREMALAAERRDISRGLKAEIVSPHPDDARITKAIDQLLANRARRVALRDEQIKEMRKVLTPVQQGKLALLMPRLERDFAQFVHDVAEKGD
jgi:Spy/CpxP family protein refolding chaperone